jgi:cytochrome c553
MREHFKEVEIIRSAVIAGKPQEAVQPATALGHVDNAEKLPKGWRDALERMRAASTRVQNSSDLAEAAAGTADIGVACGGCHQSQGGPKPAVGEPPAMGESVSSRMARHSWAMARLWEGLYVPSSPAWVAGAKALRESPFPKEVLARGGVYGRSAAKDFTALAAQALGKESQTERAALYAGLLGTCATCHIATGRQSK